MEDKIDTIPGYAYGTAKLGRSPISLAELQQLKVTAGITAETEGHLRLAGEVLSDQTQQIVDQWRGGIIASIPHLARHSRSLDGQALPEYLARSNLRFRQWILDTCLRPYDQAWLDYQHEIALRHTAQKKNQVDSVESTAFVPFRDCVAFTAVMNETIKPYLAARGHSPQQVEQMHQAWCKSIQLQMALWAKTYSGVASMESHW
jgi:hypothetical protein